MSKISRVGGFTNATARGFVSPADALRARGKLGPYGVEFELVDPEEADADATGALTGEPGTVADDESAAAAVPIPDSGIQDAAAPETDDAADEGEAAKEEESWPGSSSETSPAKQPKSAAQKKPSPRKPARSAGGPSASTTASGTAPTGTTNTPVTDA